MVSRLSFSVIARSVATKQSRGEGRGLPRFARNNRERKEDGGLILYSYY